MKITKRHLKRIIREEYSLFMKEYYTPPKLPGLASEMQKDTSRPPKRRERRTSGHGWMEFIEMAEEGDYDGAGEWIQGLAADYGIQLEREDEDDMIELAAYGGDPAELKYAFNNLYRQRK
jgi:hypothetical protein